MEKIESEIPPIFLYQIEPILQEIISKIAIFFSVIWQKQA